MNEARYKQLEAAFGSGIDRIEPLSGGLLGRSFRVVAGDIDAAVRLPGQHGARQSVASELAILEAAAAAGIAPMPIALPAEYGIVATRFRPSARPWSPHDARKTENIDRLCDRLRRLHALDITLEPLKFVDVAEHYAARATDRCALSDEQLAWRDDLLALAQTFVDLHEPSAPCHNDLVASNVIDDGAVWLIDFEFAVRGDPVLDLASLAAFNDFDCGARARLLTAYYQSSGPPFDATHFGQVIRLQRLLAYFWCLAESLSPPARAFADGLAAVLR